MAETPYTSMRMLRNTEFLLRIIHCVNQLCFCGPVLNWCEQAEVKLLASPPGLASGSSLWENIQDFESLSQTCQFARVCEDASFRHRVSAGMNCKTRPDEDDGFGQIIPLCREYKLSRVRPQSRAFRSNSWRNNYWTSH